jgi:hypothetical protein
MTLDELSEGWSLDEEDEVDDLLDFSLDGYDVESVGYDGCDIDEPTAVVPGVLLAELMTEMEAQAYRDAPDARPTLRVPAEMP